MKIRAFLAMKFLTVKIFNELKLGFVCEGIIPSRYLKITNPAMTARIPDFCLLKSRCVILQHSPIQGSNNSNVRNYDISEDALRVVSGF